MPAYLVTRPAGSAAGPFPDGANAMVVFATDAADAKAICKAQYSFDADAAWTGATVTEVVAAADMAGFTLEVTVRTATPKHFVVTGVATDTLDTLGAAMAALLNADADLASVTYTTGTQVLLIPWPMPSVTRLLLRRSSVMAWPSPALPRPSMQWAPPASTALSP
jgi:hypothetical protein